MTSADDVYWFPNLVGPIYPGSALLFRVRPYGRDPDRSIKDTWVLEWPTRRRRSGRCRRGASTADWHERNWGDDHRAGLRESRGGPDAGCGRRGCDGVWLNPRQEGNILQMHRVIDRYLS